MPSPSGTSLDVRVTVIVPGWDAMNECDAMPPGPSTPVQLSVTGEVVVAEVGVAGVADPHPDASPAATSSEAKTPPRTKPPRRIVMGE